MATDDAADADDAVDDDNVGNTATADPNTNR